METKPESRKLIPGPLEAWLGVLLSMYGVSATRLEVADPGNSSEDSVIYAVARTRPDFAETKEEWKARNTITVTADKVIIGDQEYSEGFNTPGFKSFSAGYLGKEKPILIPLGRDRYSFGQNERKRQDLYACPENRNRIRSFVESLIRED